ncbi:hypothetical protein H0I68_17165 [Yersinia kristensenii]|uniref:hypothetical protein n=1 Tax=Yersinia kristensenii TaxID=28152 RepID=UPI001C60F44F|nr:hypothetical protein [Yersinia kristensenii]HDL7826145.1 hypothetical protein [Yersinia enterocolitica]MBW5826771.1 hypothetical protein [Yersinia kristensenii]HDL7834163.1 hypothetical protein [Yersinia enterocolitica]HDL7874966.1 hypothetical protein [Yersinia enterocolitica]HDL7887621.1 hypothetical protein [Yersinia enterocolitica]
MNIFFVLLCTAMIVWSGRVIWQKQQSTGKKISKLIFSTCFFFICAGMMIKPETSNSGFLVFLVGVFIIYWSYTKLKKIDYPTLQREMKSQTELTETALAPEPSELKKPSRQKEKKKSSLTQLNTDYLKIAFNYIDSKGNETFRDVDVKSFDGHQIGGYCHLARRFRTFIIDRIDGDIILRESGEIISSDEWANNL